MPVVPMTIEWRPAWLTWVGAVTTCLDALEAASAPFEVAGASGYAFALSVNRGVCPSGPTGLDWSALATGITALGRSTLVFHSGDCHAEGFRSDRSRAHAREAFLLATREVEAGRPCVVWGLGVPEFGVVRGVDGDDYLCVSTPCTPERVPWDAIEAPGGPYVLAFPTPTPRQPWGDSFAIRRAIDLMTRQDLSPSWRCGLPAYDYWISILAAGDAIRMGHAYNARCWAEARGQAREFTRAVAGRHPDLPGLASAVEAFGEVSDALGEVAGRVPFAFDRKPLDDGAEIDAAIDRLRTARDAEVRALSGLREAIAGWPQGNGG